MSLKILYGFKLTWHESNDSKLTLPCPLMNDRYLVGSQQYWTLGENLFWIEGRMSIEHAKNWMPKPHELDWRRKPDQVEQALDSLIFISPIGWQSSGDLLLGVLYQGESDVLELRSFNPVHEGKPSTIAEIESICTTKELRWLSVRYGISPSAWVYQDDR